MTLCIATDSWREVPLFDSLPRKEVEVGFIGAGCTLYNNYALKQCLPATACYLSGHPTGWDGFVAYRMRQHGFSIRLRGDVRCEHHSTPLLQPQKTA